MNCERFRDQMLDALQGAAPAELEAHLRSCGACAQEWEALKKTSMLLDEWPAAEVCCRAAHCWAQVPQACTCSSNSDEALPCSASSI